MRSSGSSNARTRAPTCAGTLSNSWRARVPAAGSRSSVSATPITGPLWLLAELTYRCPLHCVFCYNPVDYSAQGPELATDEWLRVLREARELGAVQLGLSGG